MDALPLHVGSRKHTGAASASTCYIILRCLLCGPLDEAVRRDALLRKELLDGRVVAGVADRGHPLGLHVLEALVGARPLRIEGGAALRDRKLGLRLDAARV